MATRHMGNSSGSQSVFMCKGTRRGTLATRLCDNILSKGKVVFSRNFGLVMCRSNEHVRCLTGHNMQPTSLLPLIKGFKTRLRSRQNRIADILKLVSDPAPFSPHLLIISRLLLKNNTRIPSDPSRIPSDFLLSLIHI